MRSVINMTIVFDEQRRIYASEGGEQPPRFLNSPQRQSSPFPVESTNRRFYRRNRNSKGEEIFANESAGTLSRRNRRPDEFPHENGRPRLGHVNGPASGAQSERECESPPEPAPPEVPPRGPSLHVTLRHRTAPDQPADVDRLFLSEVTASTLKFFLRAWDIFEEMRRRSE
ncbi:unnamed protein product [Leptidea sinapis]|uniref:Uncharacterized protein n=1 Tax=Leptidea sinapis TaxID=189913 RepID=A0A5E4R8P2_9NEOP|nr:unnamed protein product [Leptidea sinapis]